MKRKIFRAGNSLVISLPKEAIDLLGLAEGADVDVEVDQEHRQVFISPVKVSLAGVDEEFARRVARFIEQYRPALQALARQ